jgi:2-polyprenyl-6-methoxyphenol hydroxylase-like FAD-dependent oxidoreductase
MRVIICGAGIGGLACAAALQAQGLEASVYESAPQFAPLGAGITLAYNAMQVMRGLGLEKPIVSRGHRIRRATICDRMFSPLTANRLETLEEEFGVPFTGIARHALHEVLISALPSSSLHLGRTLIGYQTSQAGAIAHFSDGARVDCDLLICADGLHSAARNQMHPAVQPRYSGQTSWRGLLPAEGAEIEPHTAVEAWGPGSRFGALHIGSDLLYWFAAATSPPGLKAGHHRDHRQDMLDILAPYHRIFSSVVERTDPERILRTDIWDLPALPCWQQGRVVLLGDAAHATTPNLGQGAAQALEDAYCLGLCLGRFDLDTALRRYWQLRRHKAEWIVTFSRRFGWVGSWTHPLAVQLRNWLLRLTPPAQSLASLRRIGRLDWLEQLDPATPAPR